MLSRAQETFSWKSLVLFYNVSSMYHVPTFSSDSPRSHSARKRYRAADAALLFPLLKDVRHPMGRSSLK